jgi:hypothetical protein
MLNAESLLTCAKKTKQINHEKKGDEMMDRNMLYSAPIKYGPTQNKQMQSPIQPKTDGKGRHGE